MNEQPVRNQNRGVTPGQPGALITRQELAATCYRQARWSSAMTGPAILLTAVLYSFLLPSAAPPPPEPLPTAVGCLLAAALTAAAFRAVSWATERIGNLLSAADPPTITTLNQENTKDD